MRRFLLVILALMLAVSLLGCTGKKTEETAKNTVFTDAYFEGLKSMSLMGLAGPLTGEEMKPVIDLLQTVSLTEWQEGVEAEEGSSFLLIMEYEDGGYKTVHISNATVAPGTLDSAKYLTDNAEFVMEILKAFNVPVEEVLPENSEN